MILQLVGHPPAGMERGELGIVGAIVGLAVMVAAVILFIFITQYIYKDAMKRSLNAEMWLLIAFIAPIISWIVYFIVRNTNTTNITKGELKDAK